MIPAAGVPVLCPAAALLLLLLLLLTGRCTGVAREAEEGAVAVGLTALPKLLVQARMRAFEDAAADVAAAAADEEEEEEEEEVKEEDEPAGTLLLLLRRCSCKGNRGADAAAAAAAADEEGPSVCMANSFKLSKAFWRMTTRSISVVSPLGTNTGRPSI